MQVNSIIHPQVQKSSTTAPMFGNGTLRILRNESTKAVYLVVSQTGQDAIKFGHKTLGTSSDISTLSKLISTNNFMPNEPNKNAVDVRKLVLRVLEDSKAAIEDCFDKEFFNRAKATAYNGDLTSFEQSSGKELRIEIPSKVTVKLIKDGKEV